MTSLDGRPVTLLCKLPYSHGKYSIIIYPVKGKMEKTGKKLPAKWRQKR